MAYFLDTHAMVEICKGNSRFKKFTMEEVVTLQENIAELYYILLKEHRSEIAFMFVKKFYEIAKGIDLDIIKSAMEFRHSHPRKGFSYIDCLGYIFAVSKRMIFVTGDTAFQGFKNVELMTS